MSNEESIGWMRRIRRLLRPAKIHQLEIIEASPSSWMARAIMMNGSDRRFRYQDGRLLDEAFVGDAHVV